MQRRQFLRAGALTLGGAFVAPRARGQQPVTSTRQRTFQLKYAPHFGMFKHLAGADPADQLKFAADQGFTAWEDNGLKARPVELQEQIAQTMEALGLEMGAFVATATFREVTFARQNAAVWARVLKEIRESVEVARRVNARWLTVVPGQYDEGLEWDDQTANCIELLKRCCELLEPHGLVMVLEPLNWWANQPGCLLHTIPQAYEICRAVGSPSCKILFDLYHQQITEGNLIPHVDLAWDEIAYFQCGDSPGRKEPGTGEIDYRHVFQHLHARGYTGLIGMEHGNSKPGPVGEQAVIDAYAAVDRF